MSASNRRDWNPSMAVLPEAVTSGDQVKIYNVRNCDYTSTEEYEVKHYTRTYDLDKIQSIDFVVVPFAEMPSLAHTFLSFGFEGDKYVAISVEVRREKGEEYSALKGLMNQYELMYVIGDERDLIGLRSNHRLDDVYIYRTTATKEQSRAVFWT